MAVRREVRERGRTDKSINRLGIGRREGAV